MVEREIETAKEKRRRRRRRGGEKENRQSSDHTGTITSHVEILIITAHMRELKF